MWEWYTGEIDKLKPIDTLVVNGDAIDGKGERSGATELLTADRKKQVDIAAKAIMYTEAKKVYVIKGTRYHVGQEEDWEEVLADKVGAAHCGYHEWIDCEGIIFDFKHFVGASGIPHGRATALSRAQLWNILWSERGMQPKARVIVRSHRHFYFHIDDAHCDIFNTPALQAWTKFGSAIIEGTNDIGFLSFDVDGGRLSWTKHLMPTKFMAARALPA